MVSQAYLMERGPFLECPYHDDACSTLHFLRLLGPDWCCGSIKAGWRVRTLVTAAWVLLLCCDALITWSNSNGTTFIKRADERGWQKAELAKVNPVGGPLWLSVTDAVSNGSCKLATWNHFHINHSEVWHFNELQLLIFSLNWDITT